MAGAARAETLAEVEAALRRVGERLRRWEAQFEARHGRPPAARDADALVLVKTRYRRYGVLKRKAQELRARQGHRRRPPVSEYAAGKGHDVDDDDDDDGAAAAAAGQVLLESPQKPRGEPEAVAASPELKRKRGDRGRSREIPGTPEQPFVLKRRRFVVAASPLRGSSSASGTCHTPERERRSDSDGENCGGSVAASTPDKRPSSDEVGASPIFAKPLAESVRTGSQLRARLPGNQGAHAGISQSVLRAKPGQTLREIGSRRGPRPSGFLAGAALATARLKAAPRASGELDARRAALLASPGVASPLKDASNTYSSHENSPYASPGSRCSGSGKSEAGSGEAAGAKSRSAEVKKCLFGSPEPASHEDISEKLRALRPVMEKENEQGAAGLGASRVIPPSPEAPRQRPLQDDHTTTALSAFRAEARPATSASILASSSHAAGKPKPGAAPSTTAKSNPGSKAKVAMAPRRELNQNFVKLDLRKNRWKDRKKGGSGRLKARKEMYESARGSFAASEANDHGAGLSGLISQRQRVSSQRDALEDIADQLSQQQQLQQAEAGDSSNGLGLPLGPAESADAPLCTGHQLPAVLLTVKKAGKNRGKQFYACSVGRSATGPQAWRARRGGGGGHGGCNFFMWADDQSERVAEELLKPSSALVFEEERLADTRASCNAMSVGQLKEKLKRRGLSVAGKKADLVDRAVEMAASDLDRKDAHAHIYQEMDPETGPSEEALEGVLEEVFGFESFRGDQLWAIRRIMQGKSSLLVQGTGSGKSLCYQMPALLLPGLTLVVSPLVALMEDQLRSLPMAVPGAILSHQQSGREMARTIKMVQARQIKVLFVSPERLFSSSFQRLVRTPGLLPEISLVCVDEAHCISSWSHNFRPAFLRLRELLAARGDAGGARHDLAYLRPRCVLGLTATATGKVIRDVCGVLGVDAAGGLKAGTWLRPNLALEARVVPGEGEHRFKQLLAILEDEAPRKSAASAARTRDAIDDGGSCVRLGKPASVIVYVRTRNETELVAEQLRAYGISARAYHGSMSGSDRSTVQTGFMKGSFRVVVATVAFGMGIDKANIRGVVHMGMPRSIEDYVQEVGRAGRDGLEAACVCMFDEADAMRLHSLAHAEGVDGRVPVRALLRELSAQRAQRQIAVRLDELALKLDMKEAVLETLMVHLSLAPLRLIQLLPSGYASCTITVLRARDQSSADGLLKSALEHADRDGKCALAQVAEAQGTSVSGVIRELSELQSRRVVSLAFSEPALFVRATDPADKRWESEMEDVVSVLVHKADELERLQAAKIERAFGIFSLMAEGKRADAHARLDTYFAVGDLHQVSQDKSEDEINDASVAASEDSGLASIPFQSVEQGKTRTLILSDIKGLLRDQGLADRVVSGRVLARILHGISSPCYPYARWKTSAYWGKWRSHRFYELEALGQTAVRELRIAQAPRAMT